MNNLALPEPHYAFRSMTKLLFDSIAFPGHGSKAGAIQSASPKYTADSSSSTTSDTSSVSALADSSRPDTPVSSLADRLIAIVVPAFHGRLRRLLQAVAYEGHCEANGLSGSTHSCSRPSATNHCNWCRNLSCAIRDSVRIIRLTAVTRLDTFAILDLPCILRPVEMSVSPVYTGY